MAGSGAPYSLRGSSLRGSGPFVGCCSRCLGVLGDVASGLGRPASLRPGGCSLARAAPRHAFKQAESRPRPCEARTETCVWLAEHGQIFDTRCKEAMTGPRHRGHDTMLVSTLMHDAINRVSIIGVCTTCKVADSASGQVCNETPMLLKPSCPAQQAAKSSTGSMDRPTSIRTSSPDPAYVTPN